MAFFLDSQGEFLYSPSYKKKRLIKSNVTFHLNGDEIYFFHVEKAHTGGDAVIMVERKPLSARIATQRVDACQGPVHRIWWSRPHQPVAREYRTDMMRDAG